jgi:Ca2+-binding EF-hand superfamily protein
MWNETPEVVAIREAMGLFTATLLHVCPAEGTHASAKGLLSGLLFVFEAVAVFDPKPSRTVKAPLERDVMGQNDDSGLCRWFADETAGVGWNNYPDGVDILVSGSVSFRFSWVDDPDAVFNALSWIFAWETRHTTGREISQGALGTILYPEATHRLKELMRSRDIANNNSSASVAAPPETAESFAESVRQKQEEMREFVVADLDGAIVTNRRLFFATSVIPLSQIDFMMLGPEFVTIVISAYTRLKVRCSAFRQALLLRKWLVSVLEDRAISAKDQPQLMTMMALHRQFCAVDIDGDGFLSQEEFNRIVAPIFSNNMFATGFFRIMDLNNSGTISFAEFSVGLLDLLGDSLEARVRFTFALFDVNNDGGIERSEMVNVLRALQNTGDVLTTMSHDQLEAIAAQLFVDLDTDGDGTISMTEYTAGFARPEVYATLCSLGLAGDRNIRRIREVSVALVQPHSVEWTVISRMMHAMHILGDQLYLSTQEGNVQVESAAVSPIPNDASAVLTMYQLQVFRKLHETWNITEETFEEAFAIENVASNLLLGSPRVPTIASFNPIALTSHSNEFSLFQIPTSELERLLSFLPTYAAHWERFPNTFLSCIVAVFSLESAAAKRTEHMVLVRHRTHTKPAMRIDLPVASATVSDLPPAVALDFGWFRTVMHQLEQDVLLASNRGFGHKLSVTSLVPHTQILRNQESLILQHREAASSSHEATAKRTAARESALAQDKNSGGCCGASEVKDRSPRGRTSPASLSTSPRNSQAAAQARGSSKAADGTTAGGRGIASILHAVPVAAESKALSPITAGGNEIILELSLLAEYDPLASPAKPPADSADAPVALTVPSALGRRWSTSSAGRDPANRSGAGPNSSFAAFPTTAAMAGGLPAAFSSSSATTGVILNQTELMAQIKRVLVESPVDPLPIPNAGHQVSTYGVVVFNGQRGSLMLDKSSRILYLVTREQVLFSVSLRMSYGLGLIRHKFPHGRERRQLLIRSDPDRQNKRYRLHNYVEFESVEDMEHLTSDVFRGAGTGNLSGMQCTSVRMAIIHWNVGGSNPSANLKSLFACVTSETGIVVVSASQCVFQSPGRAVTLSCEEDWSARVTRELGPSFQVVAIVSCGATRLMLAARVALVSRISHVERVKHSLVSEAGRAAGTAICVSIMVNLSPLAFIAVDLKPGATPATTALRLEEIFRSISNRLRRPVDVLNSHHNTFLFGDFNFGTTVGNVQAVTAACKNELASLHRQDNLVNELRATGSLFLFEEPKPAFPPNCNYVRNVATATGARIYDEWHRHPPSWGSRILNRCLGHPIDRPSRLQYGDVKDLLTSSHNPVFAVFDVPLRQQYVLMNLLHQPTKCIKLCISDLRCNNLAAEDLNGASDPTIRFGCSYAMNPEDDVTPVIRSTLNPTWTDTFTVMLEGIESALLQSTYLTFMITDVDTRGGGDPLGEAMTPLNAEMVKHRFKVDLPVLRHGRRYGTLHAAIKLVTV